MAENRPISERISLISDLLQENEVAVILSSKQLGKSITLSYTFALPDRKIQLRSDSTNFAERITCILFWLFDGRTPFARESWQMVRDAFQAERIEAAKKK